MTTDTAIGDDDPDEQSPLSGIDDEVRVDAEAERDAGHDITAEDIEEGNDANTSADQLSRSPTTNKLHDDGIDLGK